MSIPFILTANALSFVIKGRPINLARTEPKFEPLYQALKNGADAEALEALLHAEERRLQEAAAKLAETQSITDDVTISVHAGQVLYKGAAVAPVLTERMLAMLAEGFDLRPMARFLEKLMTNPSYRVVQHLYQFLEHGKNAITEDGDFLAYKAVRRDWLDIHSGTLDNSIGAVVSVPRNQVDEDPNRTCSHGLHVCSFEYLPKFAHADGHVVVCKVNPADVVAIPTDYNQTKMRVCRYEVLSEYEGYYVQEGDRYGNGTVASGTKNPENYPFEVLITQAGKDPGPGFDGENFELLSEAVAHAEELARDPAYSGSTLHVKNRTTDTTIVTFVNTCPMEADDEDEEDDADDFEEDDADDIPSGFVVALVSDGVMRVFETGIESLGAAKARAFDVYESQACSEVRVLNADQTQVLFRMTET